MRRPTPLDFLCGLSHYFAADKSADRRKEAAMLDAILLAAGLGFFVVAVLYVLACDKI